MTVGLLTAANWPIVGFLCKILGKVMNFIYNFLDGVMPTDNGLVGLSIIIYTIIVWISVLLSAFIDNIPYTATMLSIVPVIAGDIGIEPTILYFGLLCGATLGGNITPIGASANITGIGILRKEGHEVKTGTFMKYSVPFTLSAVFTGYLLIWLIWK